MLDVHKVVWWTHMPLAMAWVAWVGYGTISHIILGSANIFMRNVSSPKGVLGGSALAPITDFETAESFGAGKLHEFSWKQLMDVDVCVRCGRCEANCPASITGKDLSPMGFLKDIEDMPGDAKYGCKTMPIIWGVHVSKVFVSTWLVVLITSLGVIQFYVLQFRWWWSALYCFLLIIVPLLYILRKLFSARTTEDFHRLSSIIKIAMLTGILSMAFFSI